MPQNSQKLLRLIKPSVPLVQHDNLSLQIAQRPNPFLLNLRNIVQYVIFFQLLVPYLHVGYCLEGLHLEACVAGLLVTWVAVQSLGLEGKGLGIFLCALFELAHVLFIQLCFGLKLSKGCRTQFDLQLLLDPINIE